MKIDNKQAQGNTFQIDVNQALKVKNESPSHPALLGINICLLHFKNTLCKVTHTCVYPFLLVQWKEAHYTDSFVSFIFTSITYFGVHSLPYTHTHTYIYILHI